MPLATLILAAGRGSRMKSDIPKAIHRVCGKPMVQFLIDRSKDAGSQKTHVIVGHGVDQVKSALDPKVNVIVQKFGAKLFTDGLKHSLKLPYSDFEDQRSGETLSILTKVRTDTEKFIISFVNILFGLLVGVIFVSIYSFIVYFIVRLIRKILQIILRDKV